ncbi:sugar phosphate isomerase/epimerase family protein [Paenibacillus alvei]|uniref:sugar phosphate isomerase/epimerase family protein n=1 Tax=Paenibacillus alvei TaxID=44250 RepID=UPI002282100B|nr:sugar phosphate isomerase/epimerase [Paenibacillus alvei]MCY9579611.1 sugar phosphate isomerase/epimerase [Paenibacillus alvei]MCY9586571.1 sugar phosphate isomerase/epimerase [Paenibacillus alvei]
MDPLKIGVQLYTLRGDMDRDFIGTLEQVATMGYEGVEFAGYGGLTPEQLASELKRLNLRAAGSHVSIEQLTDHLDEQIEMNLAIGNRNIICPGIPKLHEADEDILNESVSKLEAVAERLAVHGMKLGYHNHGYEFEAKIGDKTVFDLLFGKLPVDKLFTELDVCWVKHGGYNPLEIINQYSGRVPFIHYKDLKYDDNGNPMTMELGQGELNLVAVAQAARAAGTEWLIVEQDDCQRAPLDSVRGSREWIKNNLGL